MESCLLCGRKQGKQHCNDAYNNNKMYLADFCNGVADFILSRDFSNAAIYSDESKALILTRIRKKKNAAVML